MFRSGPRDEDVRIEATDLSELIKEQKLMRARLQDTLRAVAVSVRDPNAQPVAFSDADDTLLKELDERIPVWEGRLVCMNASPA